LHPIGSCIDTGTVTALGGATLVGCTVKTNTTDIQTVDSVYSKTIHYTLTKRWKRITTPRQYTTKELRNTDETEINHESENLTTCRPDM
jgi:hypothetical protein